MTEVQVTFPTDMWYYIDYKDKTKDLHRLLLSNLTEIQKTLSLFLNVSLVHENTRSLLGKKKKKTETNDMLKIETAK